MTLHAKSIVGVFQDQLVSEGGLADNDNFDQADDSRDAPLHTLNESARANLRNTLGDRPGSVRENNEGAYNSLIGSETIHIAKVAYEQANLSMPQRIRALHLLAHDAVAMGYSKEAVQIAAASEYLDIDKSMFAENMTVKAHAIGMIDGLYQVAHSLYKRAGEIRRKSGAWDDATHVESLLDMGRIFHRMGAASQSMLFMASHNFEEALTILHRSRSVDASRRKTLGVRAHYDYAKTLLHIARINPRSLQATMCVKRASGMLEGALSVSSNTPALALEHANITALKGDVLGMIGEKDAAVTTLREALAGQTALSPTLVPRHVATEAKIHLHQGATQVRGAMDAAIDRLVAFHGSETHPHVNYYKARFHANDPNATVFIAREDNPLVTARAGTVSKRRLAL